jgi:hypothetical protein
MRGIISRCLLTEAARGFTWTGHRWERSVHRRPCHGERSEPAFPWVVFALPGKQL